MVMIANEGNLDLSTVAHSLTPFNSETSSVLLLLLFLFLSASRQVDLFRWSNLKMYDCYLSVGGKGALHGLLSGWAKFYLKKKFVHITEKHCTARHCGIVGAICDHVDVGVNLSSPCSNDLIFLILNL